MHSSKKLNDMPLQKERKKERKLLQCNIFLENGPVRLSGAKGN